MEVLPPKNRLDDDLAKIHAEKFRSKIAWIQHNRELEADIEAKDNLEDERLDVIEDNGIIFINNQGNILALHIYIKLCLE